MRTWRLHELGEPTDVLVLDDVPPPEPGPGEVLIDVAAAALNFPDALLCRGLYQERPPLPFAPGLEVAGAVRAVGAEVTGIAVGQRVAAMPLRPWGGLSEQTLALAPQAFPVPDTLDDAAAAALIITYQTGWVGLFHRARLQAGETLLVHAGAGGVGSAAIQLGLAAGATVIATAGGPEKVGVCGRLGAHHVIDYAAEDFVEVVKDLTAGRGADVIYDPVGGDVFDRSRKVVAWEGRVLVIGFTSGRIPEAPANHILLKNYAVVGVHWGAYNRRNPELVHRCHDELMRLHADGKIAPLVQRLVPFADAPQAIAALANRGSWGKLVVTPPDPPRPGAG
jgi:NADPH2:quinone reductase